MNPDNDKLEIYEDEAGEWRWRRVDSGNGKIVSTSGEGFVEKSYATVSATELNPGVPLADDE